ncbi:hypothetical protein GZH47_08095 [Paenibacillus rhizovicinus]|uniref:O-antigen ligase-related domain-containing protein n=1 Tax=Paenibacillus rhizovicinus TaxID=2704463 RepID=A0A6C0NX80_9BACL|nr:O-antigen ligase family protein [Paenibacillus rhizovicinus]QHW30817.1 hypothetical protein GZH47_08095 [Paenibacillus rhizovicinus]
MSKWWMALVSLLTAMALTGAAFRYGLFFDEAFYRREWLVCLSALMAMGSIGMRQWRRTRTGLGGIMDRRPIFLVLGLLMAALLYSAALLRHPASALGSLQQALRYSTYAGFTVFLYAGFGSPAKRIWLSAAMQASGIAVIGCALAGWMGALSFPSIVMTTGDARLSAVGARLAGFVQYPNFLGAVAAAYLLWYWLLLLRARTRIGFALASAGVVPCLLVTLLTESRGAWAAAAAAWLAGVVLLHGKERLAWLLYSGWTLACGSAACRAVVHAGLRGEANGTGGGATLTETLLLLAICCAAPVGFLCLRVWIGRCRVRLLPGLALAGWIIAVIGMLQLLPSAILGRLGGAGNPYATAAARGLFYRDAWKLIREAPLLGRGGDTWRSLFTGVQSQPYVGNEVHSGLLELALDLGLIGLFAGVFLAGAVLLPLWKRDRAGLLPIAVLLLHAMIDFDLSFGYAWLLMLGWLVYYSSGAEVRGEAIEGSLFGGGRVEAGDGSLGGIGGGKVMWRAAMLSAAAVCFAAAAVLGWRLDAAVRHRETAAAVSGAARAAALRAALDANPYWTRIRIELAALAPPPDRAALLAAGLRYEPQSVPLLWALGRESAAREDVRGAAGWMRRALDRDRFDRAKQTEAVVTMARLAQSLRAASRGEEAKLAADEADAFFAAYEALDGRYTANGRRFEITAQARSAAEQCRILAARPSGPEPKTALAP